MTARAFRNFALSLLEATEGSHMGHADFRVRGKIFAMFNEKERRLWIKSNHDEQRALVAMDAEAWFVPPYVGPSGWVGAVLSKADGAEVRELLVEAWRMTATKRAVREFDEARG